MVLVGFLFLVWFLVPFLVYQSSCRGRESWLFYFNCVVAVCVLCLFHMVPLVGLQSVVVSFPGHTHLLFSQSMLFNSNKVHCKNYTTAYNALVATYFPKPHHIMYCVLVVYMLHSISCMS